MPFASPIEDHLADVDGVLARAEQEVVRAWASVDPDRTDPIAGDVPRLLRRLMRGGGKRLRPTMCLLGWLAAGNPTGYDDVVTAGAALDLLHAFALTHDDVMDDSDRRRGLPSVHTEAMAAHRRADARGDGAAFGRNVAILLGDLVLTEAMHLSAALPAPMRAVWRSMLIELVSGQLRDLSGTALRRREPEQAMASARLKSGAYSIARPLELDALAAGAAADLRTSLTRFGLALGDAFALRDDLLGAFGDPAVTGKPVGDDIVAGKATLLLAFASTSMAPEVERLLDRDALTPSEVERVQDALVGCGVVERVEKTIADRVDAAVSALDDAVIAPQALGLLREAAERIAWRTS